MIKMKNTFLVVTTDVDRLRKHGVIIYQSKYTNLVGFETNKSLERVKKISGVISVEVPATGHLCA